MRILFGSANFGEQVVGGAQLSVRLVAEELVNQGHTVGVVRVEPGAPFHERLASGIDSFAVAPNNYYWHRDPRPSAPRRVAWHMRDRFLSSLLPDYQALLARYAPDVVHTNVLGGLTVSLWHAVRSANISLVHTVHDYYLVCGNSGMRRGAGNCSGQCMRCAFVSAPSRRAAKLVDGVAFVSQHMRTAHEKAHVFAPDTHVTEIIGAYDVAAPFRVKRFDARPLIIGFLGRLSPDKGVEELIASLATLPADSYRLRIGGLGPSEHVAKLRARAQGLPVEFCGRVVAQDFYDAVDVVVVPSLWNEPAARVVYEAGLSGVPVIVSARGGLPQLVEFGQRGWVYEPTDLGALPRIIRAIQDDPQIATAKAERWRAARATFSAAHTTQQTLRAYEAAAEVRERRMRKPLLPVLGVQDGRGV